MEELAKICEVYEPVGYEADETPPLIAPKPAKDFVVVKPRSSEEVARILRFANERRIPVFIRGGGTGLSGGAVPTKRGIVLSTERLKELSVDVRNRFADCGAGVTLRELEAAAESRGLSFPPHPGAETATVGGMIATNAGGMRALKYGTMRNYVLACEVVLADGKILQLGSRTLKNSTGYPLLQLFIGSEGTLGVITRATLKLFPSLRESVGVVAAFDSTEEAVNAIIELSKTLLPLALEFMEDRAVEIGESVVGKRWPVRGRAHVFAIFENFAEAERSAEVLGDAVVASGKELRDLMLIRGSIYEGLRKNIIEILDVCVPPGEIAIYLKESERIAAKYGVDVITYGHAGDGNLHQHPLVYEGWRETYFSFREELFELATKLGGVISGEHGIGEVKREEFRKLYPEQYELMRKLKSLFDPNGILNPGKVV
ncbi:MAG: FAD-binding oxidoreductase [Archaeoglobaceae archaeon]